MRKLICMTLCVSALLSMAACGNKDLTDAPAPQTALPEDVGAVVSEAVSKTTQQTSFHMTGIHSYDGVSVTVDEDGNREESPFTSVTEYDLFVNDYGASDFRASGTAVNNSSTESFTVSGSSYSYIKTYEDGNTFSGTEVLDKNYSQCATLSICAYILSLPEHEVIQGIIAKNPSVTKANGSTTVTASISAEDLVTVLPENRQGEDGELSDAAVSITISADGFCSVISLSYKFEGAPHQYQFQFSEFGQEQQIQQITVSVVTGDTWQEAFAPSSFENVTVTRYNDDQTQENPFVLMLHGPMSATTLCQVSESADGTSSEIVGMTYHCRIGGRYYDIEHGTVTDEKGNQSPHYKMTLTEQYTGETADSFAASLDAAYDLANRYNAFTYDAGVYCGSSEDEAYIYHYELAFENGRLSFLKCTPENKQNGKISAVNSYYFTDYGTTVIDLPSAK